MARLRDNQGNLLGGLNSLPVRMIAHPSPAGTADSPSSPTATRRPLYGAKGILLTRDENRVLRNIYNSVSSDTHASVNVSAKCVAAGLSPERVRQVVGFLLAEGYLQGASDGGSLEVFLTDRAVNNYASLETWH